MAWHGGDNSSYCYVYRGFSIIRKNWELGTSAVLIGPDIATLMINQRRPRTPPSFKAPLAVKRVMTWHYTLYLPILRALVITSFIVALRSFRSDAGFITIINSNSETIPFFILVSSPFRCFSPGLPNTDYTWSTVHHIKHHNSNSSAPPPPPRTAWLEYNNPHSSLRIDPSDPPSSRFQALCAYSHSSMLPFPRKASVRTLSLAVPLSVYQIPNSIRTRSPIFYFVFHPALYQKN